MRNVLGGVAATGRYDIEQIGVNFTGDYYDREAFPYRIYPASPLGNGDIYGRDRLLQALSGRDPVLTGPWEILFTLHDHFILEPAVPHIVKALERLRAKGSPLAWVGYWPVDSGLTASWAKTIVRPDIPAVYTGYGKKEVLHHDPEGTLGYREKVRTIPHGVDTNIFHPLPEKEVADYRDYYFKGRVGPKTCLVTNVNRNQWRKDLPRTFAAFSSFHRQVPDSFLYLHAALVDTGGNLNEMADEHGLVLGRNWGCPDNFEVNTGVSLEELNYIYNASSVIVSTSLGEGWGFSITEAMAAGTPVIAPHHTSIPELLGNETPSAMVRGLSVECGGPSLWTSGGPPDHNRTRPLADVEDFVDKLLFAHEHPDEMKRCAREAQRWIRDLSWKRVVQEHWLPAFKDAEEEAGRRR